MIIHAENSIFALHYENSTLPGCKSCSATVCVAIHGLYFWLLLIVGSHSKIFTDCSFKPWLVQSSDWQKEGGKDHLSHFTRCCVQILSCRNGMLKQQYVPWPQPCGFEKWKLTMHDVLETKAILVKLDHIFWRKCPLVFPLMSSDCSVCLQPFI